MSIKYRHNVECRAQSMNKKECECVGNQYLDIYV